MMSAVINLLTWQVPSPLHRTIPLRKMIWTENCPLSVTVNFIWNTLSNICCISTPVIIITDCTGLCEFLPTQFHCVHVSVFYRRKFEWGTSWHSRWENSGTLKLLRWMSSHLLTLGGALSHIQTSELLKSCIGDSSECDCGLWSYCRCIWMLSADETHSMGKSTHWKPGPPIWLSCISVTAQHFYSFTEFHTKSQLRMLEVFNVLSTLYHLFWFWEDGARCCYFLVWDWKYIFLF